VNIRSYLSRDLNALIEVTIATFGPFYENHFRPLLGEVIFHHQHGRWADDYRAMVPALHDPATGEVVTIGTGATDSFHATARALYESMGCVPVHVTYYFKQL
jgi:hypothetical protein